MNYVWLASLMILLLSSASCSQEGKLENKAIGEADATAAESPSSDGAKSHVQKYIDRLLGGDETVRNGLLSLGGIDFGRFDSIEITSSQQTYSKSGKKVDGMFSVRMRVTGKDSRTGRTLEKNIERIVVNNGGGYGILGAGF